MGNCLQHSDSDGINLVHSADSEDLQSSNSSRRQSNERVIADDDRTSTNLVVPIAELQNVNNPIEGTAHTPNIYYPSPGISRTACQLTEEEQVKIAQRIGLIHHLPVDIFIEASKTDKECIICMMEFCEGDRIRFLPCLHTFHVACIDDWLMRSFTCPSCLEPVDSALLTSYDNQSAIALSTAPLTISQQLKNLQGASDKTSIQGHISEGSVEFSSSNKNTASKTLDNEDVIVNDVNEE